MPARLFASAGPRASELAAATSAAPARPASERAVNVRVRSIPATIQETSSRPNRHLYFPEIRCRSNLPKIAGLESGGILPV
jgi:hypothetical protein